MESSMGSDINSDGLLPLQTEELLPSLGGWIKFGGLFLGGIVAAALGVSSIAQYRITVKAPAVIRPTGELQLVQARTAGVVTEMPIAVNQIVREGEVLVKIDASSLRIKQAQFLNSIQRTKLQILQLRAQVRALEHQMNAERDRQTGAIAASKAEWDLKLREYQDQQVTSTTEVAAATASVRAAQAALSAAQVKLQRYQPVADAGALGRDRLEETELDVQQQVQEVAAAQAKLERAQTLLNPTDAAVAIVSQRMAQEEATGNASLAGLSKEQEALIQQEIQLQEQLDSQTKELKQIQYALTQTTITAPADGTIAKLTLRNLGQTVQPGEELAQIVPTHAKLIIKSQVASQEISKVKIGQSAQLRISACPYPDYGTLMGMVKSISPDAIFPPANSNATTAQPYYEVTLEPQQLVLSQGDRHCPVQVGMEGKVDIVSRRETVLRTMLRKVRLISEL
jgi:HlyD family type I secretion membrane fusion protein